MALVGLAFRVVGGEEPQNISAVVVAALGEDGREPRNEDLEAIAANKGVCGFGDDGERLPSGLAAEVDRQLHDGHGSLEVVVVTVRLQPDLAQVCAAGQLDEREIE
jgi:hypothetical protein